MKQTLISLGVILLATAICFGLIYTRNKNQETLLSSCPADAMVCPDGSSVARSGPNCEFGTCKQEPVLAEPSSTSMLFDQKEPTETPSKTNTATQKSIFSKITSTATSLFQKVSSDLSEGVNPNSEENRKEAPTPSVENKPASTPPAINENRLSVENNQLVDQNNTAIYTLPTPPASSGGGTDTHVVNAIAVNNVAPVIGAIPVTGLPGKYYLSENTFGNREGCQFSNKIYILDTNTGSKILMYEENNILLGVDDPRGCDREMYLLATENEKLILKYHTLGTNMTCDSTWSEPENTWYIDVTHIENGTRRYWISPTLSSQAEVSEEQCRSNLEATTTP